MENLENFEQESDVQKFYSGKNIFLTGGTGFLGRTIMEKLLRICQVGTIYLLVRDKKGKDIDTRVKDLFDDVLYDRVREQNPNFHHKIHPIAGDCSLPGLGISAKDRKVLCKSVNVVFHGAATVRFDEKLSIAMGINVWGTREVLELCRDIEHLVAVVHISTAFANCHSLNIDEKFYKYPISAAEALKMYEELNDEALEMIGSDHIEAFPNNYTYTKALAEDLIRTEAKGLPVAIVRPALVLPTAREPVAGWINNVYGPIGIVVGGGIGLLHVFYVHKKDRAELVPVDMVVNAILVCAKDRATREHREIPIVNFVTSPENRITWGDYIDYSKEHGGKIPTMKTIWYIVYKITDSHALFVFLWFFYHTLPAFFIDIGLRVMGKRPKMVAAYRKIMKFSKAIRYFMHKKFTFQNNNLEALWDGLSPQDKELFYFDMKTLDWNAYMKSVVFGIRQYLLKDPPSTIPEELKRQQRFKILHYFLIYTLYALLGWFLLSLFL